MTRGSNRFLEKCRKRAKMRSRTGRRRHIVNGNGWTNGGIPRSVCRRLEMRCFSNVSQKSHGNESSFHDGRKKSLGLPTKRPASNGQSRVTLEAFLQRFPRQVKMQFKPKRCEKSIPICDFIRRLRFFTKFFKCDKNPRYFCQGILWSQLTIAS